MFGKNINLARWTRSIVTIVFIFIPVNEYAFFLVLKTFYFLDIVGRKRPVREIFCVFKLQIPDSCGMHEPARISHELLMF